MATSKAVLGGLGVDVERQIQDAARDFSHAASQELRQIVEERLASEDGREKTAAIARQILTRVLETPLTEMAKDVPHLPWDEIRELARTISSDLRDDDEIRPLVAGELGAALEAEGARSPRELLEEAGILDEARSELVDRLDGLGLRFLKTKGFERWLGEMLEAGG